MARLLRNGNRKARKSGSKTEKKTSINFPKPGKYSISLHIFLAKMQVLRMCSLLHAYPGIPKVVEEAT